MIETRTFIALVGRQQFGTTLSHNRLSHSIMTRFVAVTKRLSHSFDGISNRLKELEADARRAEFINVDLNSIESIAILTNQQCHIIVATSWNHTFVATDIPKLNHEFLKIVVITPADLVRYVEWR